MRRVISRKHGLDPYVKSAGATLEIARDRASHAEANEQRSTYGQ